MTGLLVWLIVLFFIVGIFVVCRDIMCWYWKINKSIENQEKIIGLLQQLVIANKNASTTANINYAAFMGEHVQVTQRSGLVLGGKVVQSEQPEKYLALLSDGNIKRIDLGAINDIKIV